MTSAIVPDRLLALKAQLAGQRAAIAFCHFAAAFERRYSDDQPRVPAGEPGAGQWMEGDGNAVGEAADALVIPVGGFKPGDENSTVQQFMSAYCLGSVRTRMPGQMLDRTIGEVQALAKSGDNAARTCIKLLGRDDYRK